MIRKITSLTILIAIITLNSIVLLTPKPAYAADAPAIVAKSIGCVAGNKVAPWIEEKISKKITERLKKSKYFGKLFSGVTSALGIGGPVLVKDDDVIEKIEKSNEFLEKENENFLIKYYRDDIIARCLARQIINNLTNNSLEIIKTRGRDGGPTFVTNWRTFITNSQYRGENIFRAMLSTTNLCSYFSNDIKKNFAVKPNDKISLSGISTRVGDLQPYSVRAGCTLPKDFDLAKYQADFAGNGGWEAYARLAQPQNNPLGAMLLAQNQAAKQRSVEEAADLAQVQANSGMTGISGKDKNDSCKIKGFGGACIVYKDIKTTGQYLADSTAQGIAAEYAWLTTSQGLGSLIENVTQKMIDRLFDQTAKGEVVIATEPDDDFAAPPTPTTGPNPNPNPSPEPGPGKCDPSIDPTCESFN